MTDPQDPTRLLHDPGVDEGLRQTLRQAASHVPPIDTAAGLARLEGAIASGAAGGGAGGGAAGGLSGGTLAAGAVAVALLGGGIWYASQAREPAMTAPEAATIEAPVAPAPAVEVPVVVEPERVIEPEAPGADAIEPTEAAARDERAEPAVARARDSARVEAPARPEPPAPLDESALAREMARIAEARRALDADPARALALVDESRREMPRSVLAQERDAIRVLALAALGRDGEAAPLAQRFLAAHPTSPFAERIRRAIHAP